MLGVNELGYRPSHGRYGLNTPHGDVPTAHPDLVSVHPSWYEDAVHVDDQLARVWPT